MEALGAFAIPSLHMISKTRFAKPISNAKPVSPFRPIIRNPPSNSKHLTVATMSSSSSPSSPLEQQEKFDWYNNWYPLMLVCDLDKKVPHAKRVLGLDVVVWWDKNENAWRVFEDTCPHRLAPLSDGRIDQWGRLQCVYHGWCFNGSGHCKFIPQAPLDGPPVHKFKQACVAVYPSTVQHDIVWFWPNADPQYKNIIEKKKPPYIPELEDPSFTKGTGNRDIPYGYDVLVENLMDPAHVPYAHYGIMPLIEPKVKADREGGRPLDIRVKEMDANGFAVEQEWGSGNFVAPCIYRGLSFPVAGQENQSMTSDESQEKKMFLIFMFIPVSPGKSRLIWAFPKNFNKLIDKIVPRWLHHLSVNLILDSDLYLLHVEERKIMERGPANWQKACFTPTKSDATVVAFRKWFNKYGGGQVEWRGKFNGALLPTTPPREQLMDRYWSHVVNCRSCSAAYKRLNALEGILQVVSLLPIGILAAAKHSTMSVAARAALVAAAVLCFAASRGLAQFIHKTFRYHDYNHALV